MELLASGGLRKMETALDQPVRYLLPVGEARLPLNEWLARPLRLRFLGAIHCLHCGRKTSKSFNQGFCYPCFKSLPQCDRCIVSPETCHYHLGTCRDATWGEQHCMQAHYVYLANSTGVKVGITRGSQLPTRWIDQGASQALPILRVASRYQSGLAEVIFKSEVADRTQWQALLKGEPEGVDLAACRDRLFEQLAEPLQALQQRFGLQAVELLTDAEVLSIAYPVEHYPQKVRALNFDKTPVVEGVLQGIKGQYLIFDTGVLNIRKFGAYHVEVCG